MIPVGIYHEMTLLDPLELALLGNELGRVGKRKAWRTMTGRRNAFLKQILARSKKALARNFARSCKSDNGWEVFGKDAGKTVMVLRVISPAPRTWADAMTTLRVELLRPDKLVHSELVYQLFEKSDIEAKKAVKTGWPSPLHPFF